MQVFDILKKLNEVSENPHIGYRFRFTDAIYNYLTESNYLDSDSDVEAPVTKEQIVEGIEELCDDLHNAAYFFDSLIEDIEKAESEDEIIDLLCEEPNL